MPNVELTLISHPLCPFVQRAAIVLLEKKVPFERIDGGQSPLAQGETAG